MWRGGVASSAHNKSDYLWCIVEGKNVRLSPNFKIGKSEGIFSVFKVAGDIIVSVGEKIQKVGKIVCQV